MYFVYTSLETTAYMELETLVETFSAELARVRNKFWFQEEWEVQKEKKKKKEKLLHNSPVYLGLLYNVSLLCVPSLPNNTANSEKDAPFQHMRCHSES